VAPNFADQPVGRSTGLLAVLAALRARIVGATVAGSALGVLVVASSVTPAAEGHGTHTQLGLPACGWAMVSGSPCPTCGMTTSFAHAVRGELAEAFFCQPMGLLLAIGAAIAFWAGLHIAVTGSQVWRVYGRLLTPRNLWLVAGLTALAWVYKWVTFGPG
jgi:hypothetical protein